MNNVKYSLTFLTSVGLIVTFSEYYRNNYFYTWIIFKNIYMILSENVQVVNPMVPSASLVDYKNKQYFINMKYHQHY